MIEGTTPLINFKEQDIADVLTDELADSAGRYRSASNPKAILLAGQPGAGKTELAAAINESLSHNAFFINADEYRRGHPNYHALCERYGSDVVKMTEAFSSAITERLIESLSSCRLNLIIEGTGRTVNVPKNTAELLTSKSYTVEMSVLAVRPEISLTSTLLRFYQMNEKGTIPRATAIEAHDLVVQALPKNLNILCKIPKISRITIWDRELRCLFDSTKDITSPSDVLTRFWNKPWTAEELKQAQDTILFLRQKEADERLGQSGAIDELERRICSASQF